ncbi:MAG: AraC family transcriptional regulator ligand-binding domain-containing protein [Aquabacterium sp.]|uniref:AraC family transcriptional regulator n=1 Tax=Aquabacterium sp. TaxID=1872578 RepID=UPI00272446DF|nr:AraC family transcriptional regulator [Aquabacterium sp.]MDO9002934.1 AraC family transcriptional regulator ligand-binding domain-containing protein [Aquabacterium sp.]
MERVHVRNRVLGTVPIALLRLLTDYLKAAGHNPSQLWGGAAWDAVCDDHLAPVSAEEFCQRLLRAAEYLDDPLLGLHLGQFVQLSHLGAMGYVLQTCENLEAVLLRVHRYHRLLNNINPVEPRIEGDHLELQWGIAHGKPGALFDEAGITSFVEIGRKLFDDRHDLVVAVDFVNPPPLDTTPFTAYFKCPVRWHQPITRLVTRLAWLQTPLPKADPLLLRLMEAQVNHKLSTLPIGEDGELRHRTAQVVMHLAQGSIPQLDRVAQALRLSPTVYARELAKAGLNFRELRQDALRQLAEGHLLEGRLSIAEIGVRLGYTQTSAFTRAFKSWTGASPLQWKQKASKS